MSAKAQCALIAACILWAASFIATKTALQSIPPLTVVTLRLIISSLCFAIWFICKRERLSWGGPRDVLQLLLLSLFGTGLHYGIQTIGLQYTTAANASLYAATGPISIALIAIFFFNEPMSWKKSVGIALSFTGVLIVQGLDTLRSFQFTDHLLGDSLVFLSILMWGIFTVLGKAMTTRRSVLQLTALVTFMGTASFLPLGAWEMIHRNVSLLNVPFNGWSAVFFLGITCSFLATILYFYALERSSSQQVGVYLYTIPPMSYIIAFFYLNESIGPNLLVGSIVVLGGVYLTERD